MPLATPSGPPIDWPSLGLEHYDRMVEPVAVASQETLSLTCVDQLPYTILQISDLHRSPADPIGNDELLSSLVSDFERAATEDPTFGLPDAIVISGDLVQGVHLDEPDHEAIIQSQYEVALDLVMRLCDRFLDGDRSRIVIVPGNHDVDWNIAFSAMQPISDADLVASPIRPRDMGPRSEIRWDWRERTAYRIADRARYEARLDHYRRFVNEVYAGAALRYPLDPGAGYALFELDAGRIGVAAFDSCSGNDCFAFHGAIASESLAQAHMDLHDRGPQYDILMAVWHHSLEGPPEATDYMDVTAVYNLIGRGFRLGLHGHQHRGQVTNRYLHLPRMEPMAVVSAGSLCAGPIDLPIGVNRQYNVLQIADDCRSVRVHVREMAVGTVFAPSLRPDLGGKGYVDMEVAAPLSPVAPTRLRSNAVVVEAENLLKSGNASGALAALRAIDLSAASYARTLALKAAADAEDWTSVIEIATPPQTIDELVGASKALALQGRFDDATAALDEYSTTLAIDPPVEADLRSFVAAKKAMA